jgi:hypothetical protein
VPVTFEDVRIKEPNTAVAETHRRWGEAVDVFPVQEGVLKLLFGDTVGGCVIELSQEPDCTDRGFVRPFPLAAQLKRRNHVLPQWAHAISPFVRRVVRLRRKTS